jgi:hypothetical protein
MFDLMNGELLPSTAGLSSSLSGCTELDGRGLVIQFLGGCLGGGELLIPFGIRALAVGTQLCSFGSDGIEFRIEAIKGILNSAV